MDIFLTILKALINFLKIPLIVLFGFIVIFYFIVFINILIQLLKGKRFIKSSTKHIKRKPSFLKRIFIDLPYRFVLDFMAREPDFFKYQGCIIFEGRQGAGKTVSMLQFAREMQREFPLSKCITNVNYEYENDQLDHWRKLIDYKNGHEGVIAVIDELQNWFSSNQSKDFPPEMLQVITQNRKNRRIILGTAQNFIRLAKPIREQATEVRRCATLLGCLTIVRKYEPYLDSEGNVAEYKFRGMYFFVHDKELRDSYDTYHVIESLSKSGFQERSVQPELINKTYVLNEIKNKK